MFRIAEGLAFLRSRAATVTGGVLVVAGIVLADHSEWWFILSGLGACGPGLLRELGLLRDQDEFQRRADWRAGYHAFLATSLFAFAVVPAVRVWEGRLRHPEELASLLLGLLWFTWLLSRLFSYWGAHKAARRILLGFGLPWLAFALADAGPHPLGWLMCSLPALPFLLLAALAPRLPRLTGLLAVGVAVGLYLQFRYWDESHMGGLVVNSLVAVLLCGPLLASGLALLARRPDAE